MNDFSRRKTLTMNIRAPDRPSSKGFALVATLSMLVLLTVIALGLLSLSAVSLRSGSHSKAQAEARANARLALMVAIGELQKQLGPDQRISANGAITSESTVRHTHWTGAWDSWIVGDPADSAVNPDYPAAASHHSTIGSPPDGEMRPDYAEKDKHFRSWLLSLNSKEAEDINSAADLVIDGQRLPSKNADSVRLVGAGSLGASAEPSDFVSARLLAVNPSSNGGRYGWWVGDESQKARLMEDSHAALGDKTLAARLSRQQAPGSMGTRTLRGLENFTDESQLAALPSLMTARLIDGATPESAGNFHHATPFSRQVLADVREGGLKRDLSALLERPIVLGENGDDFMLYRFGQERVPIQDLAAYYQLYRDSIGDPKEGNKGVQYASTPINSGIQIATPDYGGADAKEKFHRQYSGIYRSPVPIKLQLLLGMVSRPRPAADITAASPETHELFLTTTLSMTLWNPTNLPLVMDNRGRLFQRLRWNSLPLMFRWNKNEGEFDQSVPLGWVLGAGNNHICELDISRGEPLLFEPGEVKVLSIPMDQIPGGQALIDFQRWDNESRGYHNLKPNWDPFGFLTLSRSAASNFIRPNGTIRYDSTFPPHIRNGRLLFSADDRIRLQVSADQPISEPMSFFLSQDSYQDSGLVMERTYHHYRHRSRQNPANSDAARDFNSNLMSRGIKGGAEEIAFPARSGAAIIAASGGGEASPFMQVSLMAGVETHQGSSGGALGGRKFASRPFLHSTAIRAATVDSETPDSLYSHGWNWWIEPINSVLEAPVQVTDDGKGYYGGGYTPESGATHVVQQEIPVIPPMSIAALSHAHLGGGSLAEGPPNQIWQIELEPKPLAVGKGGMFPHTLQAIGNSYAHPQLPAEKTYDVNFQRTFNSADGAKTVVLADHSYLANKALWDEFFFSSITPQPASVKAFGGSERSAREVADAFFFNDEPLPNRRIAPRNLDKAKLDTLFADADAFRDGLADKIAAHLMVDGPFNINSTSIDAWRALISSLKGKPVAYLDKDKALAGVTDPDMAESEGVPVSSFTMPNAEPGAAAADPNDPAQWLGWRELSDTEIDELAAAIVRQVKLRGPFLSLSEFVNRRLDPSDNALSAKGALQAALDDPAVSINAAFRSDARKFSAAEIATMSPVFPEALEGPVAYGSAAYVDQADLLRNFAAQLTPRGDTFVIRAYGDAMDTAGNITARAWCEAVIQRVPEYSNPAADQPHVKAADLSPANKTFGRKFEIASFRWLNPDEV